MAYYVPGFIIYASEDDENLTRKMLKCALPPASMLRFYDTHENAVSRKSFLLGDCLDEQWRSLLKSGIEDSCHMVIFKVELDARISLEKNQDGSSSLTNPRVIDSIKVCKAYRGEQRYYLSSLDALNIMKKERLGWKSALGQLDKVRKLPVVGKLVAFVYGLFAKMKIHFLSKKIGKAVEKLGSKPIRLRPMEQEDFEKTFEAGGKRGNYAKYKEVIGPAANNYLGIISVFQNEDEKIYHGNRYVREDMFEEIELKPTNYKGLSMEEFRLSCYTNSKVDLVDQFSELNPTEGVSLNYR